MNYGARRPPRRWNNARAIIIGFGPFTGFKGEIVSVELKRVMVRIVLEQRRSILVELDEGRLVLRAFHEGGLVNIEVEWLQDPGIIPRWGEKFE